MKAASNELMNLIKIWHIFVNKKKSNFQDCINKMGEFGLIFGPMFWLGTDRILCEAISVSIKQNTQ